MPTRIEVVNVIAARPAVAFDLELDMDVHAAPVSDSQESATTSSDRQRLVLGDEVTSVPCTSASAG